MIKKTNFRTRNILCYPFIDKSWDYFGVIEAINKKLQPLDQDDEELLQYFSYVKTQDIASINVFFLFKFQTEKQLQQRYF